jgi:tetratricopeptide (TPR) repeat protein
MVAMEKFEKILELLEKKSLTDSEMQLLNEFSDSDAEIRSFINLYGDLNTFLSGSKHIHTELLSSYILYEMGDEPENKLIPLIRKKIKSHLDECLICNEEYTFLINDYNEVKEHVNKSVSREVTQNKLHENKSSFIPVFFKQSGFRYAFTTLAVLIVSFVGLIYVSSSITPEFKKDLFQTESEDAYLTRGRTSPLFQQGLNALDEKDYLKAIEFLSKDISEHKSEKSIFYSHYILGLTYLRASESDIFGLFQSYEKENVNLAIASFKEALDKNDSGSYESLKLDTYYYLGRAYLLVDNRDSAISSLQEVIEGKGKFSNDAQQIINDLEKN